MYFSVGLQPVQGVHPILVSHGAGPAWLGVGKVPRLVALLWGEFPRCFTAVKQSRTQWKLPRLILLWHTWPCWFSHLPTGLSFYAFLKDPVRDSIKRKYFLF